MHALGVTTVFSKNIKQRCGKLALSASGPGGGGGGGILKKQQLRRPSYTALGLPPRLEESPAMARRRRLDRHLFPCSSSLPGFFRTRASGPRPPPPPGTRTLLLLQRRAATGFFFLSSSSSSAAAAAVAGSGWLAAGTIFARAKSCLSNRVNDFFSLYPQPACLPAC